MEQDRMSLLHHLEVSWQTGILLGSRRIRGKPSADLFRHSRERKMKFSLVHLRVPCMVYPPLHKVLPPGNLFNSPYFTLPLPNYTRSKQSILNLWCCNVLNMLNLAAWLHDPV